jgi:hypothetical protein
MAKKNYNFGEKAKENYKTKEGSVELEVWQTPKYVISRTKAIELIESLKYGLDEGDFWILKNQGGKKLCYTGLIISHNGCLKINDKLEPELKFRPSSVSFVKDTGNKEKVLSYINEEQGVYEFGEISADNCKNDYPYAMVLKRLMDRVILKNSKVGFFGIYSEAESDDFKDNPEQKEEEFDYVKLAITGLGSLSELQAAWEGKKKEIASLSKYAPDLFAEITAVKEREKKKLMEG